MAVPGGRADCCMRSDARPPAFIAQNPDLFTALNGEPLIIGNVILVVLNLPFCRDLGLTSAHPLPQAGAADHRDQPDRGAFGAETRCSTSG